MSVKDIVSVTISKETPSLSRAGFGMALLAGYHTKWPNRVKEYAELTELVTDGFAITDPIYRAAQALLRQNPRPPRFKVGRRALAPTMVVKVTPAAKSLTLYTVTINGTAFTFTSDADATVPEIVAGLVTAINAGAEPVTAAEIGGPATHLTITADVAGVLFTVEVSDGAKEGLLETMNTTADPGIATDLGAIELEDDAWYGLSLDSSGSAEIAAADAWCATRVKFLSAVTADADVLDSVETSDLASDLKTAGSERTHLLYHPQPHAYGDAGVLGVMLPRDPGSITLAHKQLTGVATAKLTTAERAAIEGKNASHYTDVKGRGVLRYGITPGGEWADVTHGLDWLQAQVEEGVFDLLSSVDKVPYTDAGVSLVVARVKAAMERAVRVGLLAPDPAPAVTAPLVADVDAADKANRLLPDIVATGTLAGAVHKAQVQIKLSL